MATWTIRARCQRNQHGHRGAVLQWPQALRRKGARVRVRVLRECQQRGDRPRILEALQGVGHGPPAHARLRAVEDGGGERPVRLQADEREHGGFERARWRVALRVRLLGRRIGQRTRRDNLGSHARNGVRGRRIADQAERLRGASLDQRRGIGKRGDERLAGASVADQAERERRHLPNFGVCVREERRQRRHAFTKTDAADGQRGAAAHARLAIRQQPHQIRRRRRKRRRRRRRHRWLPLPSSRKNRRRRRRRRRHDRRGIAQHALILQTKDPRHLLFEGGGDDDRPAA